MLLLSLSSANHMIRLRLPRSLASLITMIITTLPTTAFSPSWKITGLTRILTIMTYHLPQPLQIVILLPRVSIVTGMELRTITLANTSFETVYHNTSLSDWPCLALRTMIYAWPRDSEDLVHRVTWIRTRPMTSTPRSLASSTPCLSRESENHCTKKGTVRGHELHRGAQAESHINMAGMWARA